MTDEERKQHLIEAICGGLGTDGGHHKQYALEECLRLVMGGELETRSWTRDDGSEYTYTIIGEPQAMRDFMSERKTIWDGGEYPEDWDEDFIEAGDYYVWERGVP